MSIKHSLILPLLLAFGLFSFVGLTLAPPPVKAMLPPRYTPTPVVVDDTGDDPDEPAGAAIELHVNTAPAGLWSVVQWQDSAGDWREVEGWRGTLDAGGYIQWWVAPADFGKGPFRWSVYHHQGGRLRAESEPFYLPRQAGEITRVQLTLEP